jgi:hypothetical protein
VKSVYLCGPISGRTEKEYKEHFDRVQRSLDFSARQEGDELAFQNPASFGYEESRWEDAMKFCVKTLADCAGVAVLQGWKKSKGCLLELELAGALKIPVVYIEPPADEIDLDDLARRPLCSDILRYYKERYFKAEKETSLSGRAGDVALLETVNRYLDPHGFEYISIEEGK